MPDEQNETIQPGGSTGVENKTDGSAVFAKIASKTQHSIELAPRHNNQQVAQALAQRSAQFMNYLNRLTPSERQVADCQQLVTAINSHLTGNETPLMDIDSQFLLKGAAHKITGVYAEISDAFDASPTIQPGFPGDNFWDNPEPNQGGSEPILIGVEEKLDSKVTPLNPNALGPFYYTYQLS